MAAICNRLSAVQSLTCANFVVDPYGGVDKNHAWLGQPSSGDIEDFFFRSSQFGQPLAAFQGNQRLKTETHQGCFFP